MSNTGFMYYDLTNPCKNRQKIYFSCSKGDFEDFYDFGDFEDSHDFEVFKDSFLFCPAAL